MQNFKTMTEIAALELRKAIMRGDLPSGTRLIPEKLKNDFGLSKVSIREAIRELVGSGLVESETHKGAFVADPLDLSEIKEIYEFRYQIEGRAAYLGVQNISDQDLNRMEGLLDELKKIEKFTIFDVFFINEEFHMILYRASGWRYLVKVINRMYDQVLVFRSSQFRRFDEDDLRTLMDPMKIELFIEEHRSIIERTREKKPDEVKRLIVENLKTRGLEEIVEYSKILEERSSKAGVRKKIKIPNKPA